MYSNIRFWKKGVFQCKDEAIKWYSEWDAITARLRSAKVDLSKIKIVCEEREYEKVI